MILSSNTGFGANISDKYYSIHLEDVMQLYVLLVLDAVFSDKMLVFHMMLFLSSHPTFKSIN